MTTRTIRDDRYVLRKGGNRADNDLDVTNGEKRAALTFRFVCTSLAKKSRNRVAARVKKSPASFFAGRRFHPAASGFICMHRDARSFVIVEYARDIALLSNGGNYLNDGRIALYLLNRDRRAYFSIAG